MRKVLSFVLTLALVLSSFSMAFAADPVADAKTAPVTTATKGLSDVDGIANQQAIKVCNNLGIVTGNPDGTFQPTKTVTRAEFAAMIVRAMNIPDSALAGYKTTKFKDTVGSSWAVPYLAFCESKGIMLGDGAGNAMPTKTINSNEAVTMALRAIGYTANSAKLVGTWPANYVTLAQSLGIYKDVVAVASMDKANAAQIIYNLLTVDLVQVAADGTTTTIMTTNNNTTCLLVANHDSSKEKEVIGYEDSALINTIGSVGQYAWVFRNADDKVIAIGDILSTAITGTVTSNGGVAWTLTDADDVEYTLKPANQENVYSEFSNAKVVSGLVASASTAALDVTVNIDLTNKNATKWYSTVAWDISQFGDDAKVTADEIADIKDAKLLGYDFTTNKKDEIVLNSFALEGVKALSDIKADNIVYVYASNDASKEIRKVAVGTAVVEGTVSKTNASAKKATINGTVYEYAPSFTDTKMLAGDTVKVWLDVNGDIYDYEKTKGADDFAVVINYADDKTTLDGSSVLMRVILADGSIKDYSVEDEKYKDVAAVSNAGITAGAIIKYGLDKNGDIDTMSYTAATKASEKKVYAAGNYDGLELASDAIYFTADVGSDFTTLGAAKWLKKDNYGTTTFDKLKDVKVAAYYVKNSSGKIAAMVVDSESVAAKDIYGVIASKYTTVDKDNEKVYMVDMLVNGKTVSHEFTSGNWGVIDVNNATSMGALYKIDVNASGKASLTAVDFKKLGADHDGTVATSGTAINIAAEMNINGRVVTISGAGIETSGQLKPDATSKASITVASDAVVYVWNTVDGCYDVKNLNTLKNKFNEKQPNEQNLYFFVVDDSEASVPGVVLWK